MKALIFLASMIGLVFLGGSQTTANDGTWSWFFLIIPAFILAVWMAICIMGSIWSHMEDLAKLAAADEEVTAAEERLTAVKELAADKHGLPEQLLALKQDNNPVTAYMDKVSSAISNIEQEKGRRARIQGRIAARAIGPFSIVVSTFGREVPQA